MHKKKGNGKRGKAKRIKLMGGGGKSWGARKMPGTKLKPFTSRASVQKAKARKVFSRGCPTGGKGAAGKTKPMEGGPRGGPGEGSFHM